MLIVNVTFEIENVMLIVNVLLYLEFHTINLALNFFRMKEVQW